MKKADYKIVYSKEMVLASKAGAGNIIKERWASRYRYRVGGKIFNTSKEAKEWLTGYGTSVTFVVNELVELSSESASVFMTIVPYTDTKPQLTIMNSVYKVIGQVNYVRDRFASNAKDSIMSMTMSEVQRDRLQIEKWISANVDILEYLKSNCLRKKEYIFAKKIDRLSMRLAIINRDFVEWRVDGWQGIVEPRTKLEVVHRTIKLVV